jgi:hypothetical protein
MEQARVGLTQLGTDVSSEDEGIDGCSHPRSPSNLDSPRPTQASGSSSFVSFSQHAKGLVGSFGCSGRKAFKGTNRDSSPPSATSTQTTRKTLSMSSVSNFTRR